MYSVFGTVKTTLAALWVQDILYFHGHFPLHPVFWCLLYCDFIVRRLYAMYDIWMDYRNLPDLCDLRYHLTLSSLSTVVWLINLVIKKRVLKSSAVNMFWLVSCSVSSCIYLTKSSALEFHAYVFRIVLI